MRNIRCIAAASFKYCTAGTGFLDVSIAATVIMYRFCE